jgi:hypothetical protein
VIRFACVSSSGEKKQDKRETLHPSEIRKREAEKEERGL